MLDRFDPDFFIVRVEAHILGIEPRISRTLELNIGLNLAQFHEVLQAAFGWTNSHLHQFVIGGLTFGAPEFDEDGFRDHRTFEATETRFIDFTFSYDEEPPLQLVYEYDFGDGWRHQIDMHRALREDGVKYPRCTAGSRSAPPEDVGGSYGYAEFLEAWRDPLHDDYRQMRRWAGKKFGPERFDLDATNKQIGRAMRASGGDYRFRRLKAS